MKFLVLFGGDSDRATYSPLVSKLQALGREVHFEIVSAHRNPDRLRDVLKEFEYDMVIAGAGLSAHLPGVVASLTWRPVIGMPVPAAFGGLDSLCSILQMPYGIPVLTSPPGKVSEVVSFIEGVGRYREKIKQNEFMEKTIYVVIGKERTRSELTNHELENLEQVVTAFGLDMKVVDQVQEGELNILFITKREQIRPKSFCLHVPIMEAHELSIPASFLKVYDWINQGGMWLGVNNGRNALLFFIELFYGGQENLDILQKIKLKKFSGPPKKGNENKEAREVKNDRNGFFEPSPHNL